MGSQGSLWPLRVCWPEMDSELCPLPPNRPAKPGLPHCILPTKPHRGHSWLQRLCGFKSQRLSSTFSDFVKRPFFSFFKSLRLQTVVLSPLLLSSALTKSAQSWGTLLPLMGGSAEKWQMGQQAKGRSREKHGRMFARVCSRAGAGGKGGRGRWGTFISRGSMACHPQR